MAVSSYTQDASILTVTCNVTATARFNPDDIPTQNCMFPNEMNDFNCPINPTSISEYQTMASYQHSSNLMEISPQYGYTCNNSNKMCNSIAILECMENGDKMSHYVNGDAHDTNNQLQTDTLTRGNVDSDLGHVDHLPYGVHHQIEYDNFQSGPITSPQFTSSIQDPRADQAKDWTKLLDLNTYRFDDSFSQDCRWNLQQHGDDRYWDNGRGIDSEEDDSIDSSSIAVGGSHEFSTDSSSSNHQSWHGSDAIQPGYRHHVHLTNSHSLSPSHTSEGSQVTTDPLCPYPNDRKTGAKSHTVRDKKKSESMKTSDPVDEDSGGQRGSVDVDHLISSGVMVAGYKPRNIIRKRSKTSVPKCGKDNWYWEKRRKNNESARRSRELKKEKEKDFYRRALELEYENFFLKERIGFLEAQLSRPVQSTVDLC